MTFLAFCLTVLCLALSPAQRVVARVLFDLEAPATLEGDERSLAARIFGALLGAIPSSAWRTRLGVFGRASGKTTLAAARVLYRMLTGDVSGAGVGDVPVVVVVAPDRATARLLVRRALELAKSVGAIAPLVEGETADGFTLRRPHDGALVACEAFAATRGGASLRGRSILEAVFDEAAFFFDDAGYTATLGDIYRAAIARLMPGGTIWLISTPWAESGLFYDLFARNFGAPATALVARAGTTLMREGNATIAADVEAEMARDLANALREFGDDDGPQFISAGTGVFFDAAAVDACVNPALALPGALDPHAGRATGADFAFERDSSALVGLQVRGRPARARVCAIEERVPSPGAPLRVGETVASFARVMASYGARELVCDKHYYQSIREHAAESGVRVFAAPGGAQGNFEAFFAAKEMINAGAVELPPHPRLIAQLKAVVSKPMPGGAVKVYSPRKRGQGHGDLASAFVLAAWAVKVTSLGSAALVAYRAKVQHVADQIALLEGDPRERAEAMVRLGLDESPWQRMARAREGASGAPVRLNSQLLDELRAR